MALQERQSIQGFLTISIDDGAGTILEERRIKNIVTTEGKRLLAEIIAAKASTTADQLKIFLGNNAAKQQGSDTYDSTRKASPILHTPLPELPPAPPIVEGETPLPPGEPDYVLEDYIADEEHYWNAIPVSSQVVVDGDIVKTVFTGTLEADASNPDKLYKIREAGVVISNSLGGGETAGSLFNRTTFPVINRIGKMNITFSWDILF